MKSIYVHSWGGFGSQLFALSLITKLEDDFPSKNFRLIHHTGGVTRREFELPSSLIVPHKVIDDFKPGNSVVINKKKKFRNKIIKGLKIALNSFLHKTKIVLSFEDYSDANKIWFGTYQIRGHYSYISLAPKDLRNINEVFKFNEKSNQINNSVVIHYRMGDLVRADISKQVISEEILISVISKLIIDYSGLKVKLFTEGQPIALLNYLIKEQLDFETIVGDPIGILKAGLKAKIFLGSNSKLSIWICIFRSFSNSEKNPSFMPNSLKRNVENILGSDWSEIKYY